MHCSNSARYHNAKNILLFTTRIFIPSNTWPRSQTVFADQAQTQWFT